MIKKPLADWYTD